MKKALIPAFLLVLASIVLGATVLREPLARAAVPVASVFVTNDASRPVPVREQNIDPGGNIKVHEQGTANVNVTNASLPVAQLPPVTGGGNSTAPTGTACNRTIEIRGTATALSIFMDPGVVRVTFSKNTPDGGVNVVAPFAGPAQGGNSSIVLGLTRPIAFDSITCVGNGTFSVSWVGSEP